MVIREKIVLGTAREIAAFLLEDVFQGKIISRDSHFRCCDFTIANVYTTNLEELVDISTGWYGIKSIDTGFDSGNLDLFADYYGGGCGVFDSLFDGMSDDECIKIVENMILETLNCTEICSTEDLLIAELITE